MVKDEQLADLLRQEFVKFPYADKERRRNIADNLDISPKMVKRWFHDERKRLQQEISEENKKTLKEYFRESPNFSDDRIEQISNGINLSKEAIKCWFAAACQFKEKDGNLEMRPSSSVGQLQQALPKSVVSSPSSILSEFISTTSNPIKILPKSSVQQGSKSSNKITISDSQRQVLKHEFELNNYVDRDRATAISEELGLLGNTVKNWFHDERGRRKRSISQSDQFKNISNPIIVSYKFL